MSLFLLKNTFGAKMRKGFKNFCNGENSTSTLNQQESHHHHHHHPMTGATPPPLVITSPSRETTNPTTLEEMILQLEMEEKLARRRAKKLVLDETGGLLIQHRMSCVNSSDILRSARNALNQYPRFSLDGKDAMYRSSFTNGSNHYDHEYLAGDQTAEKNRRRLTLSFPAVVGGERVIWCKPGVVGKLMGLDAMPVPLNRSRCHRRERLNSIIKSQNNINLCKRHEEMEGMIRRRSSKARHNHNSINVGSCSRNTAAGYYVTKPVNLEIPSNGDDDQVQLGWPIRRFQ